MSNSAASPRAEVETIKGELGDQVVVGHPPPIVHWGVAINVAKKPFDDERVRKALTLAVDREDMAKTIGALSGLDIVGGLEPPWTPSALGPEELQEVPGFRKDHEANVREAKRLLAEAGYPNGLKVVLTNRAVKLPYIDFAVYLISAWKEIGVEVEHQLQESATWSKSRLTRDFALMVDPFGSALVADPEESWRNLPPMVRRIGAVSVTPRPTSCSRSKKPR
jgi:ABC-type transport system substrate-binding protein